MAAPWPETLPIAPQRKSWRESPNSNISAFAPDVGPAMTRRRSTAAGYRASMTWDFTTGDLATFREFFEITLMDGALSFEWRHPELLVTKLWQFDPTAQVPYTVSDNGPGFWLVEVGFLRLT